MLLNHKEINTLDVPMHAPASIILHRITQTMSMINTVTCNGLPKTQGCGVERLFIVRHADKDKWH